MAVVQISRIQIRRGRKNSGSGLPQLASGELGWAIDSRELYIGNGAVSEGAPAVGNTKVLTEHDDIFQFANTYTYKVDRAYIQTGASASTPVERSLQSRLDEIVSIKSFGPDGETGTDQTASIQRAIDNLYINNSTKTNPSAREVLYFPAGTYEISDTIYIPPYVSIEGAGKQKTKIIMTGTNHAFETVNFTSSPGSPATDHSTDDEDNQAQFIRVSDMTIELQNQTKCFVLENCKHSNFSNLEIIGPWDSSDPVNNNNIAFEINGSSLISTSSKENDFVDIDITGFSTAIKSITDITYNTFKNCRFSVNSVSFVLGDQNTKGSPGSQTLGPSSNLIQNCYFIDINTHAINLDAGTKNIIRDNYFINVGNDGNGTEENPAHSIVKLIDSGNLISGVQFDRTEVLAPYVVGSSDIVPYTPEVEGLSFYNNDVIVSSTLTQILPTNATELFRLPADTIRTYEIEYVFQASGSTSQGIRKGKLSIHVDPTATGAQSESSVDDDYTWTGLSSDGDALQFYVELVDLDSDLLKETAVVKYSNTLAGQGNIRYKINSYT